FWSLLEPNWIVRSRLDDYVYANSAAIPIASWKCEQVGKAVLTRRVLLSALLAAAAGHAAAAPAKTYPTRIVKIIVGFLPGSTSDAMARLVADKLTAAFGQSVIVENRPGGAGSIGANAVAAADPDGYTLLVIPVDALTTALRLANKNLSYDPIKNF